MSGNAADVIERELLFPYPVDTDKIKVIIMTGSEEINMKLELIGMTAKERYALNPYLDRSIKDQGEQDILLTKGLGRHI
jgi:hypothetical protein